MMACRLIILAILFISGTADPRSPRIYNVLITSNKNLSPSHAQPVYEPVLRTTSIGYAFPPWYYHTSFVPGVATSYINPDYSGYQKVDESLIRQNGEKNNSPIPLTLSEVTGSNKDEAKDAAIQKQTFDDNSAPEQINPYNLNYLKYLPNEQENEPKLENAPPAGETDPRKVIANLKKNPEIPDVPPPPLPVRMLKNAK